MRLATLLARANEVFEIGPPSVRRPCCTCSRQYIAGSHDQGLIVKMFKDGDPKGANAISARATLGPKWQESNQRERRDYLLRSLHTEFAERRHGLISMAKNMGSPPKTLKH